MKLAPLSWMSSLVRRAPPAAPHRPPRPAMRRTDAMGTPAQRSREPEAQVLTTLAEAWVAGLPRRLQPARTAADYPRIVNRLALCWRDAELVAKVFSDLMVDRRGGRRGFPPEVAAELLALRDAHGADAASPGTRAWDLDTVATSDRDSRFDEDAIATRF